MPRAECIAFCLLDKLGEGIFESMDSGRQHFRLLDTASTSGNLSLDGADSVRDSLDASRMISKLRDSFDGRAAAELRKRMKLSRR